MKGKLVFVGLFVLAVCLSALCWNHCSFGIKPFGPHPGFAAADQYFRGAAQDDRGTSLFERGEFRSAIPHLENAYTTIEALAREYPQVREYCIEQLALSQQLAEANVIIGETDLGLAWYRKSILSSERLVEQQPDVAENHMLLADSLSELAELLAQLGQEELAKQNFEKSRAAWHSAITIDPTEPQALSGLGNIELNLGENSAAIQTFRRAIDASKARLLNDDGDFPTRTWLAGDYHNLAMLMHVSGEVEAARKNYEKAIREQELCYRHAPETVDCRRFLRNHYHALAGLLSDENRLDDAARHYKKAIKIIPHDSQLHAALSGIYFDQQRYADAIRVGTHALELELNRSLDIEAAVRMTLSQSYAFTGECDKALDVLGLVESQFPDAPSVLRCSGIVNRTCGRDAAAIASLRRYLTYDPTDATALYGMGICHLRVGNESGARDTYDALRSLDPERAASLELAITRVRDESRSQQGSTSTAIGPTQAP